MKKVFIFCFIYVSQGNLVFCLVAHSYTTRLCQYLDDSLQDYRKTFEGEEYGTHSYERVKQEWQYIK